METYQKKKMENNKISSALQKILQSIFGDTHVVKIPTEEEIREKAYFLWQEAGKPESDGVEFWIKAEKQLENF